MSSRWMDIYVWNTGERSGMRYNHENHQHIDHIVMRINGIAQVMRKLEKRREKIENLGTSVVLP